VLEIPNVDHKVVSDPLVRDHVILCSTLICWH